MSTTITITLNEPEYQALLDLFALDAAFHRLVDPQERTLATIASDCLHDGLYIRLKRMRSLLQYVPPADLGDIPF